MEAETNQVFESKLLFGKKDVASLLSISLRQLDYLISKGDLKVRRIGKRVLVSKQALAQFVRGDH